MEDKPNVGTAIKGKDPLESYILSTAINGGVFIICIIIKLFRALVAGKSMPTSDEQDFYQFLGFLGLLIFVAGPLSAFVRKNLLRREGFGRRNLITGAIVGATYGGGCYYFFGRDMEWIYGAGLSLVTAAGIWWAVTTGFNEIFRARDVDFQA